MTNAERLDQLIAQIEELKSEVRAIALASLAETDPGQKIGPDSMAEFFSRPTPTKPLLIRSVFWGDGVPVKIRTPVFVSVRPCEDDAKTHLGIYFADVACGATLRAKPEGGLFSVEIGYHNPAIWIPGENRVVLGCASWWRKLTTPEDLKEITDADIASVWYVRALAEIAKDSK